MHLKNILYKFSIPIITIVILLLISITINAQKSKFTVVIDAGHGGHDAGAVGKITREKDINLAVTLRLGELIEQNCKDVKVVFTRKNDVFLPLEARADIVNANHADLFLCIHTNAAEGKSAVGAETFTLGLAKTKANLAVAMTENSVILLEDDYKTKYKGFDPSSVDSYIMFEFMQDKYIDKSIEIASAIQKQFVSHSKRVDRGVRQAGFWVLHRSACPSVLIELGFISNTNEERYLASDKGQNELATSIYNAFAEYKYNHDKKLGKIVEPPKKYQPEKTETTTIQQKIDTGKQNTKDTLIKQIENVIVVESSVKSTDENTPIFKIQILASTKKISLTDASFKKLKNIEMYKEGNFYKYTFASDTDHNVIVKKRKEILSKFPNAYIIAFLGTKKITEKEALKLIK